MEEIKSMEITWPRPFANIQVAMTQKKESLYLYIKTTNIFKTIPVIFFWVILATAPSPWLTQII